MKKKRERKKKVTKDAGEWIEVSDTKLKVVEV